jgi:hypothetical protein
MAETEIDKFAAIDTYPLVRMPTNTIKPDDKPKVGLLCEVDFELSPKAPKRLRFYYSRMQSIALGSQTIEEKVAEIATGTLPKPFKKPRGGPRLSSMSLNNRQNAYLIFMLNADKDWQYARGAPCFTLSDKEGLEKYYMNPIAVDAAGNPIKVDEKGKPLENSNKATVAYFVAVGDKANSEHPSNEDGFNIHVDLNEESATTARFVPIIVDPDVGHPGGSEEDP